MKDCLAKKGAKQYLFFKILERFIHLYMVFQAHNFEQVGLTVLPIKAKEGVVSFLANVRWLGVLPPPI